MTRPLIKDLLRVLSYHLPATPGRSAASLFYMNLALSYPISSLSVSIDCVVHHCSQTAQLPPEPFRLKHNIVMRFAHLRSSIHMSSTMHVCIYDVYISDLQVQSMMPPLPFQQQHKGTYIV